MADNIRFTLNDEPVELSGVSPMTTLLDWLREHRGLRGTKEGCAEGDCGACTVVFEHADGRHRPINACIALLGQIDGRSLRTVEGLRGPEGAPHAVQVAMAEADATAATTVKAGRPTRVIRIARVDERTIGALMMHFILETIFAAHLWKIDAFDQPAVEDAKILTRQYLSQRRKS